MAMPALKFEKEKSVEERSATLETHVSYLREDNSEMKADIRRLDGKIDAVKDSITALTLRLSRFAVWAVLLYVALAGSLLFVLARGFKWL
jgi:hypothetical protein